MQYCAGAAILRILGNLLKLYKSHLWNVGNKNNDLSNLVRGFIENPYKVPQIVAGTFRILSPKSS